MILRGVIKTIIALFCVWHMTAIGIYSLYGVENVPVLSWLDSKREYVRPYTLITSQWQRWNLFSPDPLRRVIQMSIEAEFNGKWQTMTVINEKECWVLASGNRAQNTTSHGRRIDG